MQSKKSGSLNSKIKTMKVYLAKSNKANPDVVAYTRKKIQALGHEVVEYTGGKYNPDQIFECNLVVAVTHPEEQPNNASKYIGRGVLGQLDAAMGEDIPAVIVREANEADTKVSVIIKAETFDKTDWTFRYGIVLHDEISRPLSEILHLEINSVDSLLLACNLK